MWFGSLVYFYEAITSDRGSRIRDPCTPLNKFFIQVIRVNQETQH